MKIAIVAAEIAPYAKAGGLADVIAALPVELAACGNQVSIVLPGYAAALKALRTEPVGEPLSVRIAEREEAFALRSGIGPGGLPLFFIMHEGYFGRAGLYGEGGRDYPDNFRRYVFFGRAAARLLATVMPHDVIHAHDWHTAVLPIVMRCDTALRPLFARAASVFTIHNLAFQGLFEPSEFALLGLDPAYFSAECIEFYGRGNLMKGAVIAADAATTVSPTYAREAAQDSEIGFGLEGVLRAKGARFLGILNGADYGQWNPASDDLIASHYDAKDWTAKARCAADLRGTVGLPSDSRRALVGMVSRLSPQKGIDLLVDAIDRLLEMDLELVILGSGDPALERSLKTAAHAHPDRLQVRFGFDNQLAHKIQAGCDLFLMPSLFEPCGLTQMYALKYGTVPIVRATGGLADTVIPFNPQNFTGNGFVFRDYQPAALLDAIERALALFGDRQAWARLMANCFQADFSWTVAAHRYLELYQRARAGLSGN